MKLKRMLPLLLIAVFSIACDKEELPATGNFGFLNPDLDQGISLKLTYPDGNTKTVKGDMVFGWVQGQLLNSDHYRHMRGGGNGTSFDFRFSFPKTVQGDEVMNGTHALRPNKLRLEQTGNLAVTQTEFWLSSPGTEDGFNANNNATGTVVFKQDFKAFDNTYAVVADIEGKVVDQEGEQVVISGGFWSKKLTNRN